MIINAIKRLIDNIEEDKHTYQEELSSMYYIIDNIKQF